MIPLPTLRRPQFLRRTVFSPPATMIRATTSPSADHISPETSTTLRRHLSVTLFFAAATITCFLLYKTADSLQFSLPSSVFRHVLASDNAVSSPEFELERVLRNAAMADKTVILTTVNEAWAAPNSIFDLFLESFKIGEGTRRLLNHLVIIALDQKAFARCLLVHTHCFPLITEGVDFSEEAYFMTSDYLAMMWRRIDFLRSVLEMGYNFVFTDADIMWFRNPFPRFFLNTDFQIACDQFFGNSYNRHNRPNGGFTYVKSNNRSVEFYKFWHSSRQTYPGNHDQDVLNIIKHHPFLTQIGLKMRFLNTAYFGGFCEPSRDLNRVCTMHANCCYGLDSKLHDLRILLQDWKHFVSMPPSFRRSSVLSWTVPQNCRILLVS